jgi:hypothetical protein
LPRMWLPSWSTWVEHQSRWKCFEKK